jgi:chromosome segregation ATPase
MTQNPTTVTYSLEEILKEINSKLDNNQKEINQRFDKIETDITDLKIGQARLEVEVRTEVAGLKTEITGIKEDIKEIKGSQLAQIWTLIGVLATAVLGTVIRFVITALPANP